MSKVNRTFKHPEYSDIDAMLQDMSGLFNMFRMKVKRKGKGLRIISGNKHYQLEIRNESQLQRPS